MIAVEEALARILASVEPLPARRLALSEALGQYLAEGLFAAEDHPPFDNSAMDGFAVRAADAGPRRIVGEVAAGHAPSFRLEPGQAGRINTGSMLPEGADAVVMIEQCKVEGDALTFAGHAFPGEHLRRRGEHLRTGQLAVPAGQRIGPAEVAMAAFLGYSEPLCGGRPRVAILSTGDELVEPGQPLGPGQIRNSNAYALEALVRDVGCLPMRLPVLPDDPERIQAALAGLEVEAVITSAGVSMGQHDYVLGALQRVGVDLSFWKVRMRPGKPLGFGMWGRVPVFALPGNPVSSMVTFELFCRPALVRMLGGLYRARERRLPLLEAIEKKPGLRMFHRCKILPEGVRLTGGQGSHLLHSMVLADGLLDMPEDSESLPVGSEVTVRLLPYRDNSQMAGL